MVFGVAEWGSTVIYIIDLVFGMNMLAVVFFFTGIFLLFVEMVNPGFGITGITGIFFLIASTILVGWENPLKAVWLTAITVFVILIFIAIIIRMFFTGKLNKHFVLENSLKKQDGYIGIEDLSAYVGREGTALTVLRPSGTADFDGAVLDVVSEYKFIEKGKRITVTKVNGRRVAVKEIM